MDKFLVGGACVGMVWATSPGGWGLAGQDSWWEELRWVEPWQVGHKHACPGRWISGGQGLCGVSILVGLGWAESLVGVTTRVGRDWVGRAQQPRGHR